MTAMRMVTRVLVCLRNQKKAGAKSRTVMRRYSHKLSRGMVIASA